MASFSTLTILCCEQFDVPEVIPTVFKSSAFVVLLKADETSEFFLKIYQPAPHPELESPAITTVVDAKRAIATNNLINFIKPPCLYLLSFRDPVGSRNQFLSGREKQTKIVIVRIYFFFLFIWFVEQAPAKEFYLADKEPPLEDKSYSISLNEAHTALSKSIVLLGTRIDRFFGVDRGEDITNNSQIRMWVQTTKVEGQNLDSEANIRFKIHLPYTQKRFKFVFERKADDQSQVTSAEESIPVKQPGEETDLNQKVKTTAALQYLISETRNWNFFADTGIRVDIPPEPFARARLRRNWKLPFSVEAIAEQSIFWYLEEGFGETSSLDFDYQIAENKLFRFQNTATWWDETDTFTIVHGPTLYHTLSNRRGISYSAKAIGSTRPQPMITNYDLSIAYRQLLHKNWFFMEISSLGTFPRAQNWEFIPSISLKFEVIIGGL